MVEDIEQWDSKESGTESSFKKKWGGGETLRAKKIWLFNPEWGRNSNFLLLEDCHHLCAERFD